MIPVEDLLGRQHEPLLCIGYVLTVLSRKFQDFDWSEIPTTRDGAEAWLAAPGDSRWHQVGVNVSAATHDGDVVYCSGGPDGAYTAVLVDERGGGFLTSNKKRGCHITPRRLLTTVVSTQRRT